MHILYIHQHFTTPKGATGTRSYEMAQRLLQAGHQVTMVCGSYGLARTGLGSPFEKGRREGVVDGIKVIEFDLSYSNSDGFWKRSFTFARFAFGSTKEALLQDHDVVFATSTPLTVGIPAIAARWFRGKPYVFEVRDLWPELPRAMKVITNPIVLGLLELLETLSYRNSNKCIALAPGIAEGIEAKGVAPEKIALVPNGCDLELFSVAREPWKPEGVEPGDFLAVFTGTHGQANGLSSVIDAAQELRRRNRSDIKIALIGDGKEKGHLKRQASEAQLDNVLFFEPVSKLALVGVLKRADLGLQILSNIPAFYYGTSPNKFFDYIAAGLPVLCNYPGWVSELLSEYDCGTSVPPQDPQAFADALEFAADHRDLLETQRQNAIRLAKERFSRDKLAKELVNFVTED